MCDINASGCANTDQLACTCVRACCSSHQAPATRHRCSQHIVFSYQSVLVADRQCSHEASTTTPLVVAYPVLTATTDCSCRSLHYTALCIVNSHPRQCHQSMLTLQLTARSPGPVSATSTLPSASTGTSSSTAKSTPIVIGDEYMLKVRLLPLHLSFGQHTIDFLAAFAGAQQQQQQQSGSAKASSRFSGSDTPQNAVDSAVDQSDAASDGAGAIFFQSCDIGAVKLRIDYMSRLINVRALQYKWLKVEQHYHSGALRLLLCVAVHSLMFAVIAVLPLLSLFVHARHATAIPSSLYHYTNVLTWRPSCAIAGAYLELLNLFPLEGVGLQVERVQLTGVSGFGAIASECLQAWVRDVTGSQMHKFLAGTAAIRPLVSVGKGVADLVLVPLKQYKRDRKVSINIHHYCMLLSFSELHSYHVASCEVAAAVCSTYYSRSCCYSLRRSVC
eukprot:21539-Heterococcus_DN1.PRE.2